MEVGEDLRAEVGEQFVVAVDDEPVALRGVAERREQRRVLVAVKQVRDLGVCEQRVEALDARRVRDLRLVERPADALAADADAAPSQN